MQEIIAKLTSKDDKYARAIANVGTLAKYLTGWSKEVKLWIQLT